MLSALRFRLGRGTRAQATSAPRTRLAAELLEDRAVPATSLVADINPGAAGSFLSPTEMRSVGGQLYFTASDGVSGAELWRHDPDTGTTARLADINPGSGGAFAN